MQGETGPNSDYTRTWSTSGEIEYAELVDGTRLRYLKEGSGPPLILLHTVRTQLDPSSSWSRSSCRRTRSSQIGRAHV